MRVLRLQKPDQQYVVVELLHGALRGPSGLLATQRRAVRSQADTRPDERISRREDSRTATPKMEFPRVQLKHDQPASTPDGRSPNRGWALPFAVPQAAAPGGTLQAAGAHFPAGLTPAGKGVLTFTTDGNAGKGRLWPPRRVLQPWPGGPNSSPSPTSPSPWAYHSAGFKVLRDAPVNKAFIQIFKLSD